MANSKKASLEVIHEELNKLSAADAAELFLSPFVDAEFLVRATEESGPSMWIINRSDVYDETLKAMTRHPIEGMAIRAADKLKFRYSTITHLTPPEMNRPLNELDQYEVEDFLGHPLCPFEIILHFTQSPAEDQRSSSALSLTRRILEFPPDWSINPQAKTEISMTFAELLKNDLSPLVRAYTARVPIIESKDLREALFREKNDHVMSKLIQNPAFNQILLNEFVDELPNQSAKVLNVLAVDFRLTTDQREKLKKINPTGFSEAVHSWHLA